MRREQTDAFRSRDLTVGGVEGDERLDRRALREQLGPGLRLLPARHEAREPRVRGDRGEARDGRRRVERHVRRSGAEDAVDPYERLHRLLEEEPDAVAVLDTAFQQQVRAAIRGVVELRVREAPLAVDDRRPVGVAGRRPREQLVNQLSLHVHNPMLRAAMLY